jgi:hypothetical protein
LTIASSPQSLLSFSFLLLAAAPLLFERYLFNQLCPADIHHLLSTQFGNRQNTAKFVVTFAAPYKNSKKMLGRGIKSSVNLCKLHAMKILITILFLLHGSTTAICQVDDKTLVEKNLTGELLFTKSGIVLLKQSAQLYRFDTERGCELCILALEPVDSAKITRIKMYIVNPDGTSSEVVNIVSKETLKKLREFIRQAKIKPSGRFVAQSNTPQHQLNWLMSVIYDNEKKSK